MRLFSKLLSAAVLLSAMTACGGSDEGDRDKPAVGIDVSPTTVRLGSDAGASATCTLTASGPWAASIRGEGFTLEPQQGSGNATLTLTAAAGNAGTDEAALGTVQLYRTDIDGPMAILTVSQAGADPEPGPGPGPQPEPRVVRVDFAYGPEIATPTLPLYSKEAPASGRFEFTIDGLDWAVYADPDDSGRYGWIDNSQFSDAIPEPNKGLYFSKLGAYIELPALEGLALVEVHYTPTTSQNADVELELTTPEGVSPDQLLRFDDDGTWVFEPLETAAGAVFRLEIINRKNAQAARLVLRYGTVQ